MNRDLTAWFEARVGQSIRPTRCLSRSLLVDGYVCIEDLVRAVYVCVLVESARIGEVRLK